MADIDDAGFVRKRNLTRWAAHLTECGPRCVLEALRAVERGESLEAVLADFARLRPETYHACLYHYGALAEAGGAA